MRYRMTIVKRITLILAGCIGLPVQAQSPTLFGTVASSPARAQQMVDQKITLASYGVIWDKLQPQQNHIDPNYVSKVKADLQTFKNAGMKVSLDFGMQYPPQWVYQLPDALFVNQYGETCDYLSNPGTNGVNAVFNQAIRDAQARYVAHIFQLFGSDFFAVRLGWGYYGELNYPHPKNRDKANCYWAFDPIAQGRLAGLPTTLSPCPVPGWMPGVPSENHEKARQFANWYLDALKDYHDWQIAITRQYYAGNLVMMMGSWGLRYGELDPIIAIDLADNKRTELQRGFEFTRFIQGVTDPRYIVYCTWLDTPAKFCDDASGNPSRWSPAHYLAFAANQNPLKLRIWAENTGRGNLSAMNLSFQRARAFGIQAIIWAFENDLFNDKYASLAQYHALIEQYTTNANTP